MIGQIDLEYGVRNGERVECKERFFTVPLATESIDAADRGKANVAQQFATGIEQAKLGARIFLVRRE